MISRWPFARVLAVTLTSSALALGGAGCGGPGASDASKAGGGTPAEGSQAPEFTAEPITGEGPSSLKDANGRVVILDFWATFCEPCKKSFPKYQEFVDQFGGEMTVLAVSVDEPENATKEQLMDFAKATGVKFPIVWDKDHSAAAKYKPPTMPSSFIIDKTGVIRHVHAGYKAGEEAKIAEEIKALLGK